MEDGSESLRNSNWNVRKQAVASRRHVDLVGFSETLSEMYNDVLNYVMELYRNDRESQYSWQHFRSAADRLAEMHKFVKLTILRIYEIGIVEGAASFSSDFFEKIRDVQLQTGSENIPFDYLRQYLSRPDDPPPKALRRIKRVAVRRRSRPIHNVREIVEHHIGLTDINRRQTETGSSSYAHQSTTGQWDAGSKQSNWTHIQNTSSPLYADTEVDCRSEDSITSQSSCSCSCDEYSTDTSISTHEDDEDESDPVAA